MRKPDDERPRLEPICTDYRQAYRITLATILCILAYMVLLIALVAVGCPKVAGFLALMGFLGGMALLAP